MGAVSERIEHSPTVLYFPRRRDKEMNA